MSCQNPDSRLNFSPDDDRHRRQAENNHLVAQTLNACGLRPDGFITNADLELYYDIARDQRAMGYIAKGWDDPGFRIGDVVRVPRANLLALKEKFPVLMKYCATRGVAITGEEPIGDTFEFHLDSVIYSDGFNQKVFAQVLECLTDCVRKVRAIFATT